MKALFCGKAGLMAKLAVAVLAMCGAMGIGPADLLAEEKAAAPWDPARVPVVVRKEHPRIWLTPERLEALRAEWKAKPWEVKGPLDNALAYQVTGEKNYAEAAVQAMLAFRVSDHQLRESVSSDTYRWADWVPVVYDWCYEAMSEAQRKEFADRYAEYVDVFFYKKSWGGLKMPGNNYYNGYMRNGCLFAIAAYGDHPRAPEFYEHAVVTRWKKTTLPYHAGEVRGGVIGEGSQYDRYNFGYLPWMTEAVRTATGENLLLDDVFYQAWPYYVIYHTTPAPTHIKGGGAYWQRFPFGDCEMWGGYPTMESYLGDTMLACAVAFDGTKLAGYIRQWLETVKPGHTILGKVMRAGLRLKGEPQPLSRLPLDYFAAGSASHFYLRSDWTPQATVVLLQLREVRGHGHKDAGSFQLCRADRWLSKESTGYCTTFNRANCGGTTAHNGITFNDRGSANAYLLGPPVVKAVESRAEYAAATTDLSPSYRAPTSNHEERDDNPAAKTCIRQFVYLRPNVLVIFDRLEGTGPAAADAKDWRGKWRGTDPAVKLAFLLHSPEKPEIKAEERLVAAVNGSQKLSCRTLWPKEPAYEAIDEGAFEGKHESASWYQWRTEVSQKVAGLAFFLNVLVMDAVDAEIPKCELVQADGRLGAKIASGAKTFEISFAASVTDLSGHIKITEGGKVLADRDFYDKLQEIKVDTDGVHWEKLPE